MTRNGLSGRSQEIKGHDKVNRIFPAGRSQPGPFAQDAPVCLFHVHGVLMSGWLWADHAGGKGLPRRSQEEYMHTYLVLTGLLPCLAKTLCANYSWTSRNKRTTRGKRADKWRLCSHFFLESRIFSSCPDLQEGEAQLLELVSIDFLRVDISRSEEWAKKTGNIVRRRRNEV